MSPPDSGRIIKRPVATGKVGSARVPVRRGTNLGRARRSVMPRSWLADFAIPNDRPDPVALLESQNTSRIASLIPIRYQRMLSSPFAFFRGAALIMASDLAAGKDTGLHAQLCGDAHLSNFGLFGSPERKLVFDINDFDETRPGPWEWDVKRLLASLAVAGRANGFDADERERVIRTSAKAYRERMRTFAAMGELDVWYAETAIDDALLATVDRRYEVAIRKTATKAQSRTNLEELSKLTRLVDGKRRLVSDPPLIVPIDELVGKADARKHEQRMSDLVTAYQQSVDPRLRSLVTRFRYAGMARKVVGVGSVGIRAWVVMLLGRDDEDPLLLQVKEAHPSVLEDYLGPSGYTNAAQRVVEGERLMQASGDILLGWLRCIGPDATKPITTCVNCATGKARRKWIRRRRSCSPTTDGHADMCWPALMPVPATASRSRATSAVAMAPTSLSLGSQRHMPNRTNATMPPCAPRQRATDCLNFKPASPELGRRTFAGSRDA
jgi:uncharacterized protein (DUF2252 family)